MTVGSIGGTGASGPYGDASALAALAALRDAANSLRDAQNAYEEGVGASGGRDTPAEARAAYEAQRVAAMSKAVETLQQMNMVARAEAEATADFLTILNPNASGDNTHSIWKPNGVVSGVRTGDDDDNLSVSAALVRGIYTGAGDDSVYVSAGDASSVRTGDGDDILMLRAATAMNVGTGKGDDKFIFNGGSLGFVSTGEGDDYAKITAVAGAGYHDPNNGPTKLLKLEYGADGEPKEFMAMDNELYAMAPEQPLSDAQSAAVHELQKTRSLRPDFALGSGDDVLDIRVDEGMVISTGSGNDVVNVLGGAVGLFYDSTHVDHDVINISAGATVGINLAVLEFKESSDGASMVAPMEWSAEWDGDDMLLTIGEGTVRLNGAKQAAAIGVVNYLSERPALLHYAQSVDVRV